MTDAFLVLLASYGLPLLFVTTMASCLALPIPASLAMLTVGAFAASGEMPIVMTGLIAFCGAILGDQVGYLIGSTGQTHLSNYISRHPRRARLLAQSIEILRRRGGPGVFLSRWLFSPLGPYVNFAAGAAGQGWSRFSIWAMAGEAVWVILYIGLGFLFAENLAAIAELAGDISGLMAGLAVMAVTALWLWHAWHERRRTPPRQGHEQ